MKFPKIDAKKLALIVTLLSLIGLKPEVAEAVLKALVSVMGG